MIQLGEVVRILDWHWQGMSVSAIARQSGLDRKTSTTYASTIIKLANFSGINISANLG